MFKKRKRLLSSGIVAGLMALNCFCCLIFRTRFPASAFVESSILTASLKGVALRALLMTDLPTSLMIQVFLGAAH